MNIPQKYNAGKEIEKRPLETPVPIEIRPDSVVGDEYYSDMRVKQVETMIFDKVKRVRTSKKKELPLRVNVDVKPTVEGFKSRAQVTVQKKPKSPPIKGVVYKNEHRPTEIVISRRPLQRRASDSIVVTKATHRSVNTQTLSRNFHNSLRIRSLTPQPGDVARSPDYRSLSPVPTFASIKVAKRSEQQVKSVSPIPMRTVVVRRGPRSPSPTRHMTSLTVPEQQYVAVNRRTKSPTRGPKYTASTKVSGVLLLPTRTKARSLSPTSSVTSSEKSDHGIYTNNQRTPTTNTKVVGAPEMQKKLNSPATLNIVTKSVRSLSPISSSNTPTNEDTNFFSESRYSRTEVEKKTFKRPEFHYSAPDYLRVPSEEIRSPSPASSITSGGTSELMGFAGFARSPPDSGTESWNSLRYPSLHSITSPSQCDTDCLIVADPTTGQIPDELSDAPTEELVGADPYARGIKLASEFPRDGRRQMMYPPEVRRNLTVVHTAETSITEPTHEAFFFQSTDSDTTVEQDFFNTSKDTVILSKSSVVNEKYKHKSEKTISVASNKDKISSSENIHNGPKESPSSSEIMAGIEFHPPRFTLPLKSNKCDEGGTVKFEAVVTGFPIPAVTWLHNGNDVTNSINYEITSDAGGRCVLNIPEVFDEDAGIFTCHAINGAGEADTSAEFVVNTKTVAPQFTQHLSGAFAKQGQSVRFEVKTSGLPAPRVKWYREGAEIRHSDDFRIISVGDTHSLTITEAYEEDTGRFTVTATNNAGKATSTAMLTVSGEGSVASSVDASPPVQQSSGQKKFTYQAERGGTEASTDGPSDSDFVQTQAAPSTTMRGPPAVSPKPTRKQSPSPIRKVRMSPPRMHPAIGSQQSPLPRRQIRSVKAPTPSPPRGSGVRLAATGEGKLQEQKSAEEDAAIRIQASFKGYKTRKDLDKQRESATKIQAAYRGFRTRHKMEDGPKAKRLTSPQMLRRRPSPVTVIRPTKETAVFPPFFKVPARNVEVVEGEMSQFECHVIGNPTPTIKWYREGALIESSPDFLITYDGRMSTLLIRETYVDDAGMFTCSAQNKAGSTSCSALLTVNVPETEDEAGPTYKPEVARSISETELSMTDYEGFESTELDFVSGVSDVELTDTELTKPSASAVAHHHHHLDAIDGQQAKKLSPVAEETSATPSGKQSSKSSIAPGQQTISGAAPALVSSPPTHMRLEEGGSLRLSFVISGSPPPNVTWAKNGKAIEHGFRFKMEEDIMKHTFTMYVGMLFPEDVGEYTITATNRFGFIRGTVQLLSEEEYKINQENSHALQQQTGVPGRSTYTAQHTLAPQPVSRGRGEARHLTPTSKRQPVSPGGARMSSLSPARYDLNDRRSVSPSKRLEEVDELDIEKYFKPRFLRKPESTECNEGTATRLDCKVTGRPLPDVMWYHNGSLMHEDYSHRVVVKEDGVRSLIISPATPRDGGEYTVVAHNKAGKAVSSVTLTVIPKEGTERPRILEKPQSVNVNEGDMVRLEVFAVGRPTPEIVWLKDNVLLIPDKHPELRIEGVDGHGLLTIPVANRALHDAWYTATAVNKMGRDLTRCKVKVQARDVEPEPERKLYIPKSARRLQPPEPSPDRVETRKIDNFDEHDLYDEKRMQKPRFKKKLSSVKQKLLGSVHFECHVVPIGDPTMKVEWLLDGKPIEFANRIMTTHEFGYCSLDISAVYPRDSGVISCRATNAHGQIQTSCTLIVKDTKGLVEKTQLPETKHLENIERREKEFKGVGELYARKDPDDDQPPHAPHVVLDIDPARVKEGEPARFRCRITGYPLPKVEWFLNEQSIRKSKRFRLWYDGIHYFEIAAVRGYDTGLVRMVATNSQGTVESSAALEVYQADDLRSVLHRADKVPTTDGETDLTVKRYRTSRAIEDQMREESARKMVSSLKQVEKPSLTGQKKPMKKETEAELESKFKQLSEEEHIKQTYKVGKKLVALADDSEAPIILERVQNVTAAKGKEARFKVRFHGKPRPEVTWFFNGKPLEASDRISWTLIEENVSELVIRNTRKSDAGGISAIVSNAAGEAGSQGFLLVQEPNVLRFTSPLQDVSAKENDRSCIFECALSESYMKVEWRTTAGRHGATEGYETVLKQGDKYRMNTEGNHHYLRISDIIMEDAGTYYCVVVGQDDKQTAADLVVEAVPRKITTKLRDQTSREGLQAYYEAAVSHENVSGTWLKDGIPLQSSEKYEISEVGRRRRLNVNDLVLEDEGVYEYVYNGDSSSANLTVTALPCNITQTLSDQTAFAGNTVKFEAKVSLYGAKTYWFKNGVPITPSERISISSDHKTHTLTITTCNAEDAGQYSFKAGSSESSAQLVVQEIVVTGFLQNQSVVESQSVQLQCSIDVPGYFDGIWLHNEKLITNSEYHVIETKATSQMLTLTNVTNDDAGTYAYVTGSGTGTEAKLEVIPIKVVRPLHDITDAETKTVKLELELSHSEVEGTWWKDGIQLQGSDKHIFGSEGRVRFLEIRNLAVDDQGTYEFRAGKQMSSAHITVQGAAITKPLHDTKALETGNATMECEVAGTGVRGIWKRNGVPIKFGAPGCKDTYTVDGKKHILHMIDIDQDHAGTYTFEYGSKKTSAHLEIEGIKLMKALRNIHVADASDAVFAVEVSQDNVRNVKWERNGVEIRKDDPKYVMKSEGNRFTLTVKNVSHTDVAAYSFVAGSAKSSGRIYVEQIEFIRELQDQHIMEKRTAEFVVEIDNDNVTGHWEKDGVKLQSSDKHLIQSERKVHQLTITNTAESDTGVYKFVVGRSSTSGKLQVETVKITSRMKPKSIKETQSATFECTVSHPDITSNMYCWMKNGKEIQASEHISKTVEGYTHRLTINDCSVGDSGEYTFEAGKDKCSAKLDVQVVKVVRGLNPKRKVMAHETVVFEAQIDAPNVKAFWMKDGRRIDVSSRMTDSSSKFEARSKDTIHTLKVKDASADDEGVYTLYAGRELTSSTLYVEVLQVDITKCVKTISVVEKHEATLEFKVSKPNVKAQWFRQGIEIDVNQPRYQYEIDDRTHRLYVKEVSFSDEGEYTFQAGNQTATTFLYVQPPEPPRFVQELRNCIVIAGEAAKFTVRVTGRPEPNITWYKEGITINPSFKYKILHDEDQHTLVVIGVEESDAGEYVCEATNELGSMRTKATLEVDNKDKTPAIRQPDIMAPKIVEPIQNFITREGQSARFQCKVTGTDPKVTWYVNDKRIQPSRYFKISQFHGVCQLEITEAYPEDEGVYRVTVSNAKGEVSSSAKLQLDIAPPRVIEPLQPAHAIEGSPVKFECVIHGDHLEVRWYLEGRDVTRDSRYEWKLEENGHCWLVIKACGTEDAGEVRCHSSNASGEAVCSTDLIVSGLFETTREQDVVVQGNDSKISDFVNQVEKRQNNQSKNTSKTQSTSSQEENCQHENGETLLVTSSMTGKEFTIRRSDVTKLAKENYFTHSKFDPSLSDTPILLRKKTAEIEEDLIRPAFTQKLKPVTVETDDTAEIMCRFIAAPRPAISWYHNGNALKTGGRMKVTVERDMFSYLAVLEIQECSLKDVGLYKVVVRNKEGECQSTANVDVTAPQDGPRVPKLNLNGLGDESQRNGRLNSSGSARMPFSPKRYLERARGREGRSQSLREDFRRTRSFEYSLPSSRRSTLSAENANYRASSMNNIPRGGTFPLRGRRVDSISSSGDDQTVQNMALESDVSSLSTTTSTTTLRQPNHVNSHLNDYLTGRSRFSDETRSFSLELPDFDASSDIVTHSTASTSGVFMMDESIGSRRSSISGKKETPVIVDPLPDIMNVVSGNQLTLICKVSGRPRPKPVWLKDAIMIPENSKTFIFDETDLSGCGKSGYVYSLTVKRATPKEAGDYTFSALNVAGDVSCTVRVNVGSPKEEKFEAPSFTKKLKPIKTKLGKKVRLECELTGSLPIQVTWSKDSVKLSKSNLVSTDENSPFVEFPDTSLSDSGTYSIMAKNKYGVATCSASLIVEGP